MQESIADYYYNQFQSLSKRFNLNYMKIINDSSSLDAYIKRCLETIEKYILNSYSIDIKDKEIEAQTLEDNIHWKPNKYKEVIYIIPKNEEQLNSFPDKFTFKYPDITNYMDVFVNALLYASYYNIPTNFKIVHDKGENAFKGKDFSRITLYYNDLKIFHAKFKEGIMKYNTKCIITSKTSSKPTKNKKNPGVKYLETGAFYLHNAVKDNSGNPLLISLHFNTHSIYSKEEKPLPPYLSMAYRFCVYAFPEGFESEHFDKKEISIFTENYFNELECSNEEDLLLKSHEVFGKTDDYEMTKTKNAIFHDILNTAVRSNDCVNPYERHLIGLQWLKLHKNNEVIQGILDKILLKEVPEDDLIILPRVHLTADEINTIITIGDFDVARAVNYALKLRHRMKYLTTIDDPTENEYF